MSPEGSDDFHTYCDETSRRFAITATLSGSDSDNVLLFLSTNWFGGPSAPRTILGTREVSERSPHGLDTACGIRIVRWRYNSRSLGLYRCWSSERGRDNVSPRFRTIGPSWSETWDDRLMSESGLTSSLGAETGWYSTVSLPIFWISTSSAGRTMSSAAEEARVPQPGAPTEARSVSPAHSVGERAHPAEPKQATPKIPMIPRNANGDTPTSSQRLKTACSQCRQQKIKCRTSDELATPCERCARMKLTCLYEPRNARGRPRSDSIDASGEANKRRLVSKSNFEGTIRSFPAVNVHNDAQTVDGAATERRQSVLPELPYAPGRASISSEHPLQNGDSNPEATKNEVPAYPLHQPGVGSDYRSPLQTLPRVLNGLSFDAETIDNLFETYFKYYHSFVPVLDPSLRPNEYYTQSPFLFSSVLAIASRRDRRSASLTSALRIKVLSHIPAALFSPNSGPNTLTASLLLLSWHLPETDALDETPYVASIALVHAAERMGMHRLDRCQDFSRVNAVYPMKNRSRRLEIYIHCLLLSERYATCESFRTQLMLSSSAIIMGNPPARVAHIKDLENTPQLGILGSPIGYQVNLASILASANRRATDFETNGAISTNGNVYDDLFHDEIRKLEVQKPRGSTRDMPLEHLSWIIAHLTLQTLQFFKKDVPQSAYRNWRLPFDSACELIHQLHDLEKLMRIDMYGPWYVYQGVLLAACTLFRCLKTPFADQLGRDGSTAQGLFFSAITMMRNVSLGEGDRPSRSAEVLQYLWRSDTIFKNKDGSWDLDLKVRSRFSSSVIYDLMTRSREELRDRKSVLGAQHDLFDTSVDPNLLPHQQHGRSPFIFGKNDGFDQDPHADMAFPQDWVFSEDELRAQAAQ